MRRALILAIALAFGAGSLGTACKVKERKHKKHKRYKDKHRSKGKKINLNKFFGDSGDVYLRAVPVRLGQSQSQAAEWLSDKRNRKFRTKHGRITAKANFAGGKVVEIKATFKMDMGLVLAAARAKWGPPTKADDKRTKWAKDGVEIILKQKEPGSVKLSIRRAGAGKGTPPGTAPLPGVGTPPAAGTGGLNELFGDAKTVYLAGVPTKLDDAKATASAWYGPKGKKKLEGAFGKATAKAVYSPAGKVVEIKVMFKKIALATVLAAGKAKWGEPKKTEANRTIWVKDGIRIALKQKDDGTVKLAFAKGKKGKGGGMGAAMKVPAPPMK